MKNEIAITHIAITGSVFKGMTVRGPGFIVPVMYTLADGQMIESRESATRKKDLLPRIESLSRAAEKGMFKANFHDGKFWGTIQTYAPLSQW